MLHIINIGTFINFECKKYYIYDCKFHQKIGMASLIFLYFEKDWGEQQQSSPLHENHKNKKCKILYREWPGMDRLYIESIYMHPTGLKIHKRVHLSCSADQMACHQPEHMETQHQLCFVMTFCLNHTRYVVTQRRGSRNHSYCALCLYLPVLQLQLQ